MMTSGAALVSDDDGAGSGGPHLPSRRTHTHDRIRARCAASHSRVIVDKSRLLYVNIRVYNYNITDPDRVIIIIILLYVAIILYKYWRACVPVIVIWYTWRERRQNVWRVAARVCLKDGTTRWEQREEKNRDGGPYGFISFAAKNCAAFALDRRRKMPNGTKKINK